MKRQVERGRDSPRRERERGAERPGLSVWLYGPARQTSLSPGPCEDRTRATAVSRIIQSRNPDSITQTPVRLRQSQSKSVKANQTLEPYESQNVCHGNNPENTSSYSFDNHSLDFAFRRRKPRSHIWGASFCFSISPPRRQTARDIFKTRS